MAKRMGNRTILFETPPYILSYGAVGGKKEGEGPLGKDFDRIFPDPYLGKPSFEVAESELQKQSLTVAMEKGGIAPHQIDCLFAGDLLNQCVGSTLGLASFGIPQVGIYGACSTMALGLALASCFVETGLSKIAGAVTSSHFCASERQFRFPLEYGGQRPQVASWTATASGSILLSGQPTPIAVKGVTFGTVQDLGVKDANNMGAAMAPAAAHTITHFLEDTRLAPTDFDMILTGDLGAVGSSLVRELTAKNGYDIAPVQRDCGLMIYHIEEQDIHAGGSGCGCSAGVLCSRILNQLKQGKLKRILFVATGSLHSPTLVQQSIPIPGIAHAVWLENGTGA